MTVRDFVTNDSFVDIRIGGFHHEQCVLLLYINLIFVATCI